jgi:rhamnose transport system permease protein
MATTGNDSSPAVDPLPGLPSPGTPDRHAARRAAHPVRRIATALAVPEPMVAALLVVVLVVAAFTVRGFADVRGFLLPESSQYVETGIMALAMTFIIIGGHIDLSCASALALVGTSVTWAALHWHIDIRIAAVGGLLLGVLLGSFNGWLVAVLGLPSLVVTLGTFAAFRGLAQVLAGDGSLTVPEIFRGFDRNGIANVPMPLVVFIALAIVAGIVLHRSIVGRWVFALGTNSEAARYAGVPVRNTIIGMFAASGLMSAIGALMMMSRLGYARYDDANGFELDVITAVVLGGASIVGGRGTIVGTVMAMALIGALQEAMGVAGVGVGYKIAAAGGLLIFAVLASNLMARLRR